MTKKSYIFRKGLVIGIIILFVGASFIPSISSNSIKKEHRVASTGTQPFDPFNEGWQYRKEIIIDHTKVTGDLTSFPVLISTIDVDLRDKAQDDGDDILFMDDIGVANKLSHEIEYFDDSSGELVAWVNITSLSSSVDTIFYMYYGNPGCTNQQFPEMVWDTDYLAVYHMDGSSYTDIDDSTSNNLDVVNYQGNPVYQHTGKVGFCVDFDDDSLNVADSDLLSFTDGSNNDKPFTIEAWIKFDTSSGDYNPILSKYGPNGNEWLFLKHIDVSDRGMLYFLDDSSDGSINRYTESALNVDNSGWNYFSAIYNGDETGYDISFILDGIFEEGDQFTSPAYAGMENTNAKMRIGAYYDSNGADWYYWQGLIDEVRISNIARTTDWLKTSYNTMNDPSSFFSVGPEETNQPPYSPSNPNPPDGATDVDVNAILSWTCSDPDGDDLVYDVYFEADDPSPDVLVSYHQSQTFYNPPGQMEYSTHYYWQIVAWDPYGASTNGPIWDFITGEPNDPPDPPSDPDPEDGATDVDVNAILWWTCSDPDGDDLVYDVYFEADDPTPDVLVSYHQSQTFYNPPGQIEFNTHYYWRIIAWDPYGASTTGPIWDFITGDEPNDPPDPPSDPDPEDGATDVDINADLSWTCSDPDGDDLVYDVYFEADDPDPDVLVSDDQTSTTYDPGEMETGVTYYWQIIAKDEHGASTTGPIWHFTTKGNSPPNPPIITGPTTGKEDTSYPFTFMSTDPEEDEVSYYIRWGDGVITDWTSFQSSGPPGYIESHSWDTKGIYVIQAQAKDVYDAESEWGTYTVTITKNKNRIINSPFLNFLENHPILYQLLQRFLQL